MLCLEDKDAILKVRCAILKILPCTSTLCVVWKYYKSVQGWRL